eukprot:1191582-Prymnesium_polylepis.1
MPSPPPAKSANFNMDKTIGITKYVPNKYTIPKEFPDCLKAYVREVLRQREASKRNPNPARTEGDSARSATECKSHPYVTPLVPPLERLSPAGR